jgi:SAM-dependent methyltransferase
VIHDNACGAGAVTQAIIELKTTNITIDATDINPQFVAGCAALAEKNKWPVTTAVMSAQELTFPAETFTHSFNSFAFHCIGDSQTAAEQIYRTLKPDGIAIASIWIYTPHVDALQHAHWRTRGQDSPMPALLSLEGFKESDLKNALEAGGFEKGKISFSEKEYFLKVSDLRRWAQLAWSYLGALPGGWSQRDEDKWDEAIAARRELALRRGLCISSLHSPAGLSAGILSQTDSLIASYKFSDPVLQLFFTHSKSSQSFRHASWIPWRRFLSQAMLFNLSISGAVFLASRMSFTILHRGHWL